LEATGSKKPQNPCQDLGFRHLLDCFGLVFGGDEGHLIAARKAFKIWIFYFDFQ